MAKKKTTAKKKAVAKRGSTAVAVHEGHTGKGFENQTQKDIAIPFLTVLQATSPQVAESKVKGAKPGMLFNTVTEELVKECLFVPSVTENCFVEWRPRDAGGGFVSKHGITSDVVKKAQAEAEEFGKLKTADGNDLVETFYYYGVICDDEEPLTFAVLAFKSTQIKVYRRFNTRLSMFQTKQKDGRKVRPDMFRHLMLVSSVPEKNDKGSWHSWKLECAVDNKVAASLLAEDDPRAMQGENCYDMVVAGTAKIDYESAPETNGGAAEDDFGGPF